jgi:uncharacterized membrane protein
MARQSVSYSHRILLAAALVSVLGGSALAQSNYTYSTIPRSYVGSINNKGQMVGYDYINGQQVGFLLENGVATPLVIDGTPISGAWSINDRGQIAASTDQFACVIDKGQITVVNIPNSYFNYALGVNNRNQVCGFSFGFDFLTHGYVLNLVTGELDFVDHPDAVFGTAITGMNDVGQLVGYYVDADFNFVGFLYAGGVFTTITGPDGGIAYASGINNRGQIGLTSSNNQGFVLSNGKYTPLGIPGTVGVTGINDRGQVVGYVDAISFLATPSH